MKGMGVSYEGFAWSGTYGLVRGEEHGRWNRVVGSDWWWGAVRSPPRSLSTAGREVSVTELRAR